VASTSVIRLRWLAAARHALRDAGLRSGGARDLVLEQLASSASLWRWVTGPLPGEGESSPRNTIFIPTA
jgi:hypothetical protein